MSEVYERFVRWFLRLNGYFTIESFIIHAADDPARISQGLVAPYTETDILGVRMPYSKEITGDLYIANFEDLVINQSGRIDIVIAEVKSGNDNRPNKVWRESDLVPIQYIVRFLGLLDNETEIGDVASCLASQYHYSDENRRFRIRYIIFANEVNAHYSSKIQYITYSEMIRFLVEVRGQCWVKQGIGVASAHRQWDPLIVSIFDIANDQGTSIEQRLKRVLGLFAPVAVQNPEK